MIVVVSLTATVTGWKRKKLGRICLFSVSRWVRVRMQSVVDRYVSSDSTPIFCTDSKYKVCSQHFPSDIAMSDPCSVYYIP